MRAYLILSASFSTSLERATSMGNVRVELLTIAVITARQCYGEDRANVVFFFETGYAARSLAIVC